MQMEKCCRQLQSLGGSGYVLVVETALPLYSVSFKHTSIFGADVTACCQGGAGVHRGADPNYRVSNLFQVIFVCERAHLYSKCEKPQGTVLEHVVEPLTNDYF